MEKLKSIPRNYVQRVEYESYVEPTPYSYYPTEYGRKALDMPIKMIAKMEIKMEMNTEEDRRLVMDMEHRGLDAVADRGMSRDKFRYVMNQGYMRIPALLKHEDPEIAQLAWILSKFFSKRDDLMPEDIVE